MHSAFTPTKTRLRVRRFYKLLTGKVVTPAILLDTVLEV